MAPINDNGFGVGIVEKSDFYWNVMHHSVNDGLKMDHSGAAKMYYGRWRTVR